MYDFENESLIPLNHKYIQGYCLLNNSIAYHSFWRNLGFIFDEHLTFSDQSPAILIYESSDVLPWFQNSLPLLSTLNWTTVTLLCQVLI